MSVNTDLIPAPIVCCFDRDMFLAALRKLFCGWGCGGMSGSFFEKMLSEPHWRNEKNKQMLGARRIFVFL